MISLALAHGNEHQVTIRPDGNHFDVVLSHSENTQPCPDSIDRSRLLTAWLSRHDHERTDHVLHCIAGENVDQLRSRNNSLVSATDEWTARPPAEPRISPWPQRPDLLYPTTPTRFSPLGLLCLRTTVLVI
jgi:hypothetical protein